MEIPVFNMEILCYISQVIYKQMCESYDPVVLLPLSSTTNLLQFTFFWFLVQS